MKLKNLIKKNAKIIKFLIVWITSTLIDIIFLYIFVSIFKITLFLWVFFSFLLAVINWFILNKFWTFNDKTIKYKRQFIKFFFVSIGGLFLTLILMYFLTIFLWIYYLISKILTSLIVVIWNFLWNNYWTFKIKKKFDLNINDFKFKYSIIIPAFNEEKRLPNTLKLIYNFFKDKNIKYEIIVVDDWSTDNTNEIIEKLKINNLKILKNIKNKWKWFSVKKWVLAAKWKYILFTDADNSTPIEELNNLKYYLKDFDIIIWSRYCDNSNIIITQSKIRQIIWKIWNKIIQYFLINWIQDTQCWFKLFKHNIAKKLFWLQKINWWWFDMEILLAWKSMWYKIKEVPVNWSNSNFSRVRPIRDSFKTLLELIFIKINFWFDWYK